MRRAYLPIVYAVSIVIIATSIIFCYVNFDEIVTYNLADVSWLQPVAFVLDALIAVFILYQAIRNKSPLLFLMSITQLGLLTWFEFFGRTTETEETIFLDKLSLIMILIVGIIGPLICMYSVGYLKEYHEHHKEVPDRTGTFLLIEILFLIAMFGLVVLNDMTLMLLCWEMTTLASYLLIGYTKTPEAVKNSMFALRINVLGGLLFTVAIVLFDRSGTTDFRTLASLEDTPLIQVAVLFMGFAALTKSAQFPFSRWLLGAMVAPTPSSALLHSSTMVKAGVYLILRLAPHLGKTEAGITITLIGSITFFVASLMTVSQTDAKRMLAFSTISNLGLIIAVGAVATAESIWAAVMLIIFHAVTKALLFLAVGTTEHQIGSRGIEDMDGLFLFSRSLGIVMLIGIAGMFVAPFGMLISKWAAMKAFLDSGNMFIVLFLAFGSAAILFAWTKWMGNIIAKVYRAPSNSPKIPLDERASLYTLAGLVTVICLLHFLLSTHFVEPYIHNSLGLAIEDPITLTVSTVFICILCALFVIPVLLIPLIRKFSTHHATIYMGGANASAEDRTFYGSLGKIQDVELRNFYMKDIFGESFWIGKTIWLGILILLVSTGVIVGGLIL